MVDRSGHEGLDSLRALQDFRLRPALESVPGVAEVATVGGFQRTWQLALNPLRMVARKVSLDEVVAAVAAANQDVGGEALEVAEHEQVVVGRGGALTKPADLAAVVVRADADGTAIRLGDLGEVEVVPAPRRGIATLDGDGEVVGGIVVMRNGENALRVIERVKARLDELRDGLFQTGCASRSPTTAPSSSRPPSARWSRCSRRCSSSRWSSSSSSCTCGARSSPS